MSIYNKLLKIHTSENIVCYKIETNEKRVVVSINYNFFRFFFAFNRITFYLLLELHENGFRFNAEYVRDSRFVFHYKGAEFRAFVNSEFLLKTESMTARYQYTNRIGQFCSTKEVFLCCNFAHELRNPFLVDIKFRIPFS